MKHGQSLIRVPEWVPQRLGRFYLYYTGAGETNICGASLEIEENCQPTGEGVTLQRA